MNMDKFIQAIESQREYLDKLKKAIEEIPRVEPVLNKSRLAKATGFGTRTIANLMKSGAVPTYEQGKKAKASDIQRAMQDRPARMMGKSKSKQPFKRIQVY